MKLQFKIPLIFFTLAILLGTPLLFTVKSTLHQILIQDVEHRGTVRATDIAESATAEFETQNEQTLLPLLQSGQERTGALFVVALSPTGQVLAHTNVAEKGKIYSDPATLDALKSTVAQTVLSERNGNPVMDVFVPVWANSKTNRAEEFLLGGGNETPERIRLGTVRIALPLQEILDTQYRLFKKIAGILLLAGVVGLTLLLIVIRRILFPIQLLSEATSRISQGEYEKEVPVLSQDELGHLADDFNHMRKALAETTVSKDYLSGVLDNLADPLIVTSPDTTIRDVNPAALHLLGYTQGDLVGKPLDFLFSSKASPLQVPETHEQLIHSTLRNVEVLVHTKQGEETPVLLSSSVFKDPLGNVADIIVTAKDMTERKRMEGLVRQSDKMSAVGQLAAGVAHEINNPLGVILGFVEAIEQDMQPSDPLAEPMKAVIRETLRCKTLVQNLLTFSRERQPGMRHEDPVVVVENALSLVETQARVKNVQVNREFKTPLSPIQMDRNQIEQAVINLCTNAMDAMPTGGQLTVGLSQTATWLDIRVTDTGTGIDPEIQQRIFEPFFSTKDIGKGTGLGLSLVYDTVKKHQGTVDLKSVMGQGTTFIIRLPLQPASGAEAVEDEG